MLDYRGPDGCLPPLVVWGTVTLFNKQNKLGIMEALQLEQGPMILGTRVKPHEYTHILARARVGCIRSWATLTLSRLPDPESNTPFYLSVLVWPWWVW